MKRRSKPLRLHIAVYAIIVFLLFSVIGVVAIYLNNINQQQAQQAALQDQIIEEQAPIIVDPVPLTGDTTTGDVATGNTLLLDASNTGLELDTSVEMGTGT